MPRPADIDRDLKISEVSRLMPWHGYVNTKDILHSLNRQIDDCAEGKQVFFSFYEDKNRADQTGLFFFRGKPGAPFALICPGGGFAYVGSLHEGFPLAQAVSEKGFNAFVIQYRIGGARVACEDLAQALAWIIDHAKELEVAPTGYIHSGEARPVPEWLLISALTAARRSEPQKRPGQLSSSWNIPGTLITPTRILPLTQWSVAMIRLPTMKQ